MLGNKIIQDSVHGYITIPENYCHLFIDTLEFQRLRRVEQTSVRPLFPSARHDRFIHSLGTYHLGRKVFQSIKHNSFSAFPEFKEEDWKSFQESFEIACLLHDCGHAPFSHTFEKYYDFPSKLLELLKKVSKDEQFNSSLTEGPDAAPHERVSAYLALTIFRDKINSTSADPILVARMILGCKYFDDDNLKSNFLNCLISWLKGPVIDVDRLDYITRDKWASGFSSANVNIERLISSICFKRNNNIVYNCFYKNALSEIQGVLDVKNFQQMWIFSHHKVKYDEYILIKAIEKLSSIIIPSDKQGMSQLFNIDSFHHHIALNEKDSIYMPSDDDLVHLLKKYIDSNEYAYEWLSRNHKLKPVWKTFAEYNSIFSSLSAEALKVNGNLVSKTDQIVKKFLKVHGQNENSYLKLEIEPNFKSIGSNEVFISVNNHIIDYYSLNLPNLNGNLTKFFFYLFVPFEMLEYSEELKEKLIKVGKL